MSGCLCRTPLDRQARSSRAGGFGTREEARLAHPEHSLIVTSGTVTEYKKVRSRLQPEAISDRLNLPGKDMLVPDRTGFIF
jgi:hypothetical protein